ncbi:MAG TPA: trigger factor [Steroidobacteraceae bacterium]|nr:trigger factor [Steroidobacteraceae bacterium]
MQVSVEATGALERRMEIQVPAGEVEKAIDERLKSMSRTVRLKGFRPGKAPVKVVRQKFGQQVRQEVISDLMQSSFAEAVRQEQLAPAGGPKIEPLSLAAGEDLRYRAVFEIFPRVELKGLDTLALERPVATVSEADVDAMIENLRNQRPNWVAVEREARDEDRVRIDFKGTVDGEPFEGGSGEDVVVQLGAGRMLPEFEAGLRGAQAGETRQVELTFPADYHATHLAGKQAKFDIEVRAVEQRELPDVDDEFCKAFGVTEGGVEQLRTEVEENMARELTDAIQARLKQQVLDKLLTANPIEVPSTLVEAQVREMQLEAGRRMGAQDVSQLPPPDSFREAARRRVALGLLINELIRAEKIEVDRARLQARLEDLAAQYPEPEKMVQAYRQNADAMRQVEMAVLEDQVVDSLIERASVTERKATFRELMNFGA